jgi:hypothetical protein
MLRSDLVAAGIPYETGTGVIDFHALRGTYVSHLVASGASVKVCQTLARHSTPSLTIGIYAKASVHDLTGAVEALPDLNAAAPRTEALAATGTDRVTPGRHAPAAPGQRAGDGMGRELSAGVAIDDTITVSSPETIMGRKSSDSEGLDADCRSLSAPVVNAGGGIRTHTGVPPRRILSPLSLTRW